VEKHFSRTNNMKQKDYLFILISSAIVVVIWITFNILHNVLTSTISESLGQQLVPIAGTFDTQTLDSLKKRAHVTPLFIIIQSPTPTPTLPPVTPIQPIATASAPLVTQIILQQQATQGGRTQ
jgi:hypothetical protein